MPEQCTDLPVYEVVGALEIDRFDGWPSYFHDIVNKFQERPHRAAHRPHVVKGHDHGSRYREMVQFG